MTGKIVKLVDILVNEGFFPDYASAKTAMKQRQVIVNNEVFTEPQVNLFSGQKYRFDVMTIGATWQPLHPKRVKPVNVDKKGKMVLDGARRAKFPWLVKVVENYLYDEFTWGSRVTEEVKPVTKTTKKGTKKKNGKS